MGDAKRRRQEGRSRGTAGSHYVLIIEWLASGDRKTGARLADRLRSWGVQVVHRECACAADVLATLYEALEAVRIKGAVPVVHLEAHGLSAPKPGDDSGLAGPDGAGGGEILLWTQMAPLMGQLNLASQFELLVVGAACYGLTALDGFNIEQPAPFSALVGFGTAVHERRLEESMVELYRHLFRDSNGSLPIAVQAANRELSPAAGEALITTSFQNYADRLIRGYARRELEPTHRHQENERLARERTKLGMPTTVAEMTRLHRQIALRRCQQAVRTWFAYAAVPANRQRYRFDIEKIFREEIARHRRRRLAAA